MLAITFSDLMEDRRDLVAGIGRNLAVGFVRSASPVAIIRARPAPFGRFEAPFTPIGGIPQFGCGRSERVRSGEGISAAPRRKRSPFRSPPNVDGTSRAD